MIIKTYQLKIILDYIKSYCNHQQCTECPFSDKEPDPSYGYEVAYTCRLSAEGHDPWNWDTDFVKIEEGEEDDDIK